MRLSCKGWTPLHAAAFGGHALVVTQLLSHGAQGLKAISGETAMDVAVQVRRELEANGNAKDQEALSRIIDELQSAKATAKTMASKRAIEQEENQEKTHQKDFMARFKQFSAE